MTTNPRVPKAELSGFQGSLLKMAVRKKIGRVPENVEVMWNHPAVFKDLMRVGARTERWDRLDQDLATYAVMAAAAEIGCGACLDLNYFMAHDKGLSVDKAREVPRWRDSQAFSTLERRVMEYAVAMCRTPPEVTDEMSAALLADLGADGLIELTAKVGFMNLAARSNVALGIPSEHFADACGLQPLANRPVRAAMP
jgi:alkylhydroperoxidase family enzyme